MREALRRTLWLIPTVFIVSLGVFWLLSRLEPNASDAAFDQSIPLFFNPTELGVTDRAKQLADQIAREEPTAKAAGSELVKLGGAALPGLIPYFDSLAPQGRGRVALALAPLAERMGIGSSQELDSSDTAILFWTRYWADHGIDFRASMVNRVVQRLVTRSSPARRAEVQELDTYALDALIRTMAGEDTVEALSELTDLASHVSGVEWRVPRGASLGEAYRIRVAWQDWWVANRARYTNYEGGSKVLGMFQETRYGRWVARIVHGQLGASRDAAPTEEVTGSAVGVSLALLASGLIGGYAAGPLLAAVAAGLASRYRRRAIVFVCLFLTSFPSAALLSWLRARTLGGLGLGAFLMFIFGASLIGLYQYQAIRDTVSFDYVQAQRAFGATRLRTVLTALRSSGLLAIAHLANRGPSLFTGICIVEYALHLPGLGRMTVLAIHDSNVGWLMLSACFSTLLSGLLQIAGSLWLKRFAVSEERL